jgi:hypothetical protein
MSNVIRPSGPLPARVYWVRRLVLVGVVVLVAAMVWWLVSGLGGSSPSGGSPNDASLPGAATQTSTTPSSLPSTSTSQPPTATDGAPARIRQHASALGGRHGSTTHQTQALPAPTGDCAPSDIGIDVQMPDTTVGQSTTATLSLTTLDSTACTLQITPTTMVLRITSGADVIWTSDDCPNLLPARQVVVRGDPATTYRFSWDGHRSVQGCVSPGQLADPGGYSVEAALVGADVHKGYFEVKG